MVFISSVCHIPQVLKFSEALVLQGLSCFMKVLLKKSDKILAVINISCIFTLNFKTKYNDNIKF